MGGFSAGVAGIVWSAPGWQLAGPLLVTGAISGLAAGCAACVPVGAAFQAILVGALGGFTLGVLSYELLGSSGSFAYSVLGYAVAGLISVGLVRCLCGHVVVPSLFAPEAPRSSES